MFCSTWGGPLVTQFNFEAPQPVLCSEDLNLEFEFQSHSHVSKYVLLCRSWFEPHASFGAAYQCLVSVERKFNFTTFSTKLPGISMYTYMV